MGAGELRRVEDELPSGFDTLRAEAAAEGHRFIDRLAASWAAHAVRFDRAGELLLAAYVDEELAGIGGLTVDPAKPGALRMRRFYVRPSFRRIGIGRRLANALLEQARRATGSVTVNAQPASFDFWQSLGFVPDMADGHTHVQRL